MQHEQVKDLVSVSDLDSSSAEDDGSRRFLVFSIAEEYYACALRDVCEVVKVTTATSVPFTKSSVAGIINLRGKIVSLIDMRQHLGFAPDKVQRSMAIIAERNGKMVAGLIDGLHSVTLVDQKDTHEDAGSTNKSIAKYSTGIANIDGHLVRILNFEKLFFESDLRAA